MYILLSSVLHITSFLVLNRMQQRGRVDVESRFVVVSAPRRSGASLLGPLASAPFCLDELIVRTGLTASQVLATLSVLELKRLVRRLPGASVCAGVTSLWRQELSMVSPELADQAWVIKEYESNLSRTFKGKTIHGVTEFQHPHDGSIPRPVTATIDSPDGLHTFNFLDFDELRSPDQARFTLASFGLPEIRSDQSSSSLSPMSYWSFLGAMTALAAGGVFRYLSIRVNRKGS